MENYSKFYFWWKLGSITMDSEDPLILLNGSYLINFFVLESCTTINNRKEDVNKGCGLSCIRGVASITLGVGQAFLLYVGQRTTNNSSSRRHWFNLWTNKVESIWLVWFLFVSKRHVKSESQTILHLLWRTCECKILQFLASLP